MRDEQHRVMIESPGTACHHIGQPATVISAYLQMMQEQESNVEMKEMIDNCMTASGAISETLRQRQLVSQYRTVPYLSGSKAEEANGTDTILKIEGSYRRRY